MTTTSSAGSVSKVVTKAKAILRRGVPSLRNVVFSWFDYWPASSLSGHWLSEMPIFCINLAKESRRRSIVLSQAQRLGLTKLELVEAVDASTLSYEKLAADGLYDHTESLRWHRKGLTINEVACSLSHLACYRRIVENDSPWGLVIEDDALFRADRLRRLSLDEVPAWADIAFLNAFYAHTPPADPLTGNWYGDHSYAGSGAAYLMRSHAARALLTAALPVVHAADGLLGRSLVWSGTEPHAFRQQGSTIELRSVIAWPEAVTNGSTEHYYRSSLR